MSELKAIQTEYKGYRFRSRLEARWAVFFDACGVDWEYEPEGYDLGDGLYYLPDFLLSPALFSNRRRIVFISFTDTLNAPFDKFGFRTICGHSVRISLKPAEVKE